MKFIISASTFQKQLSAISGVVSSNPIVPILENFLLEISNGTLTISASDLQISMVTKIDVESQENGKLAVPAKLLLDSLKSLPDQPLTCVIDETAQNFEITHYKGKFKLSGAEAEDFPKIPVAQNSDKNLISSHVLLEAIGKTIFAVGNDEIKPAMTGVLCVFKAEYLEFVSTDSLRLVRYTYKENIKNTAESKYIIPKKALNLLKGSLPTDFSEVEVQFTNTSAFFSFNNVRLVCRLIDENFPDYSMVIPKNNELEMTIDRQELLGSLKRLAIFTNKNTKQIRLKITKSTMQISAEDEAYSNEGYETLICDYNRDEEFVIGFQVQHLTDALQNLDGKEVKFCFSQPNKACVVIPTETSKEDEILMLLMPAILTTYAN